MASKTILLLLGLTIIAVAYAAYEETEVVEEAKDDELSVDDLAEYFQAQQMEKRGRRKVGSCMQPNGKPCAICNLKITNKNDRRRYIACQANLRGL